MNDDLYSSLVCALTHNINVCETCKKCKGDNCAEIRANLVKDLALHMKKDLPFTETRMTEEYKNWIKK